MKKVLLVLSLIAVLWSCKKSHDQNESLKPDSESSKNKSKVLWAADGKWDLLGFGYDVTGDVLNGESASDAPIIDMGRFEKDYIQRIGYSNTGSGTQDFYVGVSALDYLKDVIKKRSIGITASYDTQADKKFYFSGSVSKNRSDQHTSTFSSRYSYATFESFRAVKRLWFTQDAPASLLINYLTPEFVDNIATLDANSLVRRYGTHVLLDITIGGKLRLDYSSVIEKESEYTKKERATKVGLVGGVKKILGINFDATVTNEEITKTNTESRSKQYTLKFFGGTNSGRTISFDSEGNTTESLNIASWEQSVIPTNSALVHVDNAVPIYYFIADPIKKGQVKAAVDQYIIDNQATELGEVAIYEYWNSGDADHYLTADYEGTTTGGGGWIYQSILFNALKNQAPNSVPIYEYWNSGAPDHYLTADYEGTTTGGGGWRFQKISFYAFRTQVPGSIPIYEYWNSGSTDHYLTPNYYGPTAGGGGWRYQKVAFYAYPNY